ncbi:MAG: hypothetical protein R6W91_06175 [Thermoplasmata archaeon]
MKALQALALFIAVAILILPSISAQSIEEPRFVNRMISDFQTPSIEPGGSGTFRFSVNNPDPINLTAAMENVSIEISIYHYATLEESLPVSEISNPPVIVESSGTALEVDCGNIQPGAEYPVEFNIDTVKKTPHGSYFSQSSYFVRFMLAFSYQGANFTMASRGHFTDQEWELLKEGGGAGEINRTYLKELGYDGIIPDSAFSVRIPIPMWPFYALVGLTALSGAMAFSFHVLDNPGRYPKLELRLLRLSGRLAMYRASMSNKLKHDRKKI